MKKTAQSELCSLRVHDTWKISDVPKHLTSIPALFILTKKRNREGFVARFKAKIVACGFLQGIVERIHASVVYFPAVRTSSAVAVRLNYFLEQMDVCTTFLHGELAGDVYVLPTERSGIKLGLRKALKPRERLYGLKQASRVWFKIWTKAVASLGYQYLGAEACLF